MRLCLKGRTFWQVALNSTAFLLLPKFLGLIIHSALKKKPKCFWEGWLLGLLVWFGLVFWGVCFFFSLLPENSQVCQEGQPESLSTWVKQRCKLTHRSPLMHSQYPSELGRTGISSWFCYRFSVYSWASKKKKIKQLFTMIDCEGMVFWFWDYI